MTIPDFYNKFHKGISWIKSNTIYLARHGSMAYGTNTPESDEDFKGICIPTKPYFLGSQHRFEQAELREPDCVIFDIRKFFNLAASANPNIIEVLFVDDSDIIHIDEFGQTVRANRDRFLSKRIKFTFSGYAISQLKRMKLHRKYILNPPKAPLNRSEMGLPEQTLIPQDQMAAADSEIQKELDRLNFDFMEELSEPVKLCVKQTMSQMLSEMKITSEVQWQAAARKVGLTENFIEIMQKERAYKNQKTEWDNFQNWKNTRNKKRYELEEKCGFCPKNAYHLIRLMRMCKEILSTGKVFVKRPDREELLAIRNGAWTYDELIEFADKEDKEIDLLYKTSDVLPKTPDFDYLDNLCVELVEKSLSRD